MHNIQQHTFGLARYTYMLLSSLCHGNGQPVARIYTEGQFESPSTQGAILNFNLMDSYGQIIGYSQVHKKGNWTYFYFITVSIRHVYAWAVHRCIITIPLLCSGGQNGQSVQYSRAHRLLLQHRRLSVLPWDHQSAHEEKPAGMIKE